MNQELLRAVDLYLEEFYPRSVEAGRQIAANNAFKKSQIRGFERIVLSAVRFSQIINFIKNRAGKDRNVWGDAAALLLPQLTDLETKAVELAQGDVETILKIKLLLARGWAAQVVAHYLYAKIEPVPG